MLEQLPPDKQAAPFAALRLRTDAAKRFKKVERATADGQGLRGGAVHDGIEVTGKKAA